MLLKVRIQKRSLTPKLHESEHQREAGERDSGRILLFRDERAEGRSKRLERLFPAALGQAADTVDILIDHFAVNQPEKILVFEQVPGHVY